VTRLAADRLAQPGALLLAVSMDDLRDERGALSTERTIAASDAVLADRPHWAKPEEKPASPRMPNLHNGARRAAREPEKLSFGTALKNARFE
jgi:hypothetical protein